MGRLAAALGVRVKGDMRIELLKDAYVAGEMLQGVVHVRVRKPIVASALVVFLIGEELVRWKERRRSGRENSRRKKHTHTVLNKKILLATLPAQYEPGDYVYPFQCELPATLPGVLTLKRLNFFRDPSSLLARVQYTLSVQLDVNGFFVADLSDELANVQIHALPPEPPYASLRSASANTVTLLTLLNQGQCEMAVVLRSSVLVLGDRALVRANIRNRSRRQVRAIGLQLIQVLTLIGKETAPLCKVLCDATYHRRISAGSEAMNAEFELTVPRLDSSARDRRAARDAVVPSTVSETLFAVRYVLRLECRFALCQSVGVEFPVTVLHPSGVDSSRQGDASASMDQVPVATPVM